MTQISPAEPIEYPLFLAEARASGSRAPWGPIRWASAALRRQIVRLNAARETRKHYRATYWALMELDDRMLKDIGVSRSDIKAVALGTFADGSPTVTAASRPRLRTWIPSHATGGRLVPPEGTPGRGEPL